MCKVTPEKWQIISKGCARVNIAAKLRYNYHIFRMKENSWREKNNFVICLFILSKVAAKWQLLTLLFRRATVKTSHKFATSPDTLVANVTVLVNCNVHVLIIDYAI